MAGRHPGEVHDAGDLIRAAEILAAYIEDGPHSDRYLREVHLVVAEYDCAQIVGALTSLATATLLHTYIPVTALVATFRETAQELAGTEFGREGALWADPEGDPTCQEP